MSHSASPAAADVEPTRETDARPAGDPVSVEQPYVTMLYGRLDARRKETAELLARVLRNETTGTPQAVSERDAAAAMYSEQLATLSAVEEGLCFGRLDVEPDAILPPGSADAADPETPGFDQEVAYIGRLGLLDEDHDYEPLLIDWRAPVARPVLHGDGGEPGRHPPAPPPAHPQPQGPRRRRRDPRPRRSGCGGRVRPRRLAARWPHR